ncbi:MAG: hypothetical protein IJ029_06240 [Lachnospiraceae bacterium]|nr:hypothetical protein [Lachnospiraceae bacterium]
MTTYNDIGIDSKLDWERIAKLFRIGLFAGIMVLIGDMLLGFGVPDESLSGMEKELSTYLSLSDTRIFWSAFLGLIGIPLEGLCYFGVYRLMAEKSPKHAHAYRSGILGYLIFGACGVHVPCLSSVFFYKYMVAANPEIALEAAMKFGGYFLLPGMILFMIFFFVLCGVQISAFVKGLTLYPKWCFIFSLPIGMLLTMLFKVFGNHVWVNALTAGWISIGNIWMFGGLLLTMKTAQKNGESK